MRHFRLAESIQKDDIRYRGPLSYTAFKLLCWLCISAATLLLLVNIASYVNEKTGRQLEPLADVLDTVKDYSLPFFLLGNFAMIIDNKRGFKRQLLINCGSMLLVIAACELLFYRYFVGINNLFAKNPLSAQDADYFFLERTPYGFLSLNVFVDLLLCAQFMFFMTYRPTKHFQGKRLVFFRLFALIPVLYDFISLSLKGLSALGRLRLPTYVNPLLTVKPPTAFVLFVLLIAFIRLRGRAFYRLGYAREDYEAFLKTRRNSWHFSVFAAFSMLLIGLIDLMIYTLMTRADPSGSSPATVVALAVGVGDSTSLILLSPLMLLFSYTRRNKSAAPDLIVPMVGWCLVALTVFEGSYQLLTLLKHNMFGY